MRWPSRKTSGKFCWLFQTPTFVLMTVIGCGAGLARAQDLPESTDSASSQDYDQVLDSAVEAFGTGDFARAHDLFRRAYGMRPNARVLRGIGIAALRLAHYSEAKLELSAALNDPRQPLTGAQRDEVTKLMAWMQSSLGTVRLRVDPRGSRIELDGEPTTYTELTLTPGIHRVRVSLEGYQDKERTVDVTAAHEESLDMSLTATVVAPERVAKAAEPAPVRVPKVQVLAPPTQEERTPRRESPALVERWWFWTIIGVAVAGGAAAVAVAAAPAPSPKPYEKGGVGDVIFALGRHP
jgi:hypothetical protein